jgi:uncharacterized protein YkwD
MSGAIVGRVRPPNLALLAAAVALLAGCRAHDPAPPSGPRAGQWTGPPAPPPLPPQAPPNGAPTPWSWPGLPAWPAPPWSVPAPGGGLPPTTAPTGASPAQRCVDGINAYRATKGLAPLARATQSEACASSEAADDARSGQAHGTFGRCGEHAQNACPNWPGPAEPMIDGCLRSMWNEGPGPSPAHGHYENMANRTYTSVACGFSTQPDGSLWSVQNFY